MIAVLKLELWLTFWVALALGLAFGLPVLEMNEDGVLGLTGGGAVSKALARLAIALPLGLALFQFGLQRMRGTLAVLLHRGIEARDAFRAKFVLALVFSTLVFLGLVLLEYRISVGQQGPNPRFVTVLWVVPQMVLLGALSWTAGALIVLGGGRSTAGIALRCLFGGLAVVGVHRWASSMAAGLAPATGYALYLALLLLAGAATWRAASARFGDDGPPEPRGEARIALRAALFALLLFPYFDGVGSAASRLAWRGLEPSAPQLWTAPDGQTLVAESRAGSRTYRTLDGEVVHQNVRAALPDHELVPVRPDPVWRPTWDGPDLLPSTGTGDEFPPPSFAWSIGSFNGAEVLGGQPAGGSWGLNLVEDSEGAGFVALDLSFLHLSFLPGTGAVELLVTRPPHTMKDRAYARSVARRPDGGRLSSRTRFVASFEHGLPLLLDDADGTLWTIEPRRGAQALVPAPLPPGGELEGWSRVVEREVWRRLGSKGSRTVAALTADGAFVWQGDQWVAFESTEKLALEQDLDPSAVGPLLMLASDPLGAHTARLLGPGGVPEREFDLRAEGSRADSSRTAIVALEVLRPPLERLVELASSPFARAHQAQLPAWLFGLHLTLGLACAGFGWRRGRSPRGRLLFAGLGLLGGPLAAAAVHVCRGDLDDAEAAGPAGAASAAGRPVFLDAGASLDRRAA